MIVLPVERIEELDKNCGEEIDALLNGGLDLSNMHEEDYTGQLREIATRLEISFDELCSYTWLQASIASILRGYKDNKEQSTKIIYYLHKKAMLFKFASIHCDVISAMANGNDGERGP
jgi:hypothetical protein